ASRQADAYIFLYVTSLLAAKRFFQQLVPGEITWNTRCSSATIRSRTERDNDLKENQAGRLRVWDTWLRPLRFASYSARSAAAIGQSGSSIGAFMAATPTLIVTFRSG